MPLVDVLLVHVSQFQHHVVAVSGSVLPLSQGFGVGVPLGFLHSLHLCVCACVFVCLCVCACMRACVHAYVDVVCCVGVCLSGVYVCVCVCVCVCPDGAGWRCKCTVCVSDIHEPHTGLATLYTVSMVTPQMSTMRNLSLLARHD